MALIAADSGPAAAGEGAGRLPELIHSAVGTGLAERAGEDRKVLVGGQHLGRGQIPAGQRSAASTASWSVAAWTVAARTRASSPSRRAVPRRSAAHTSAARTAGIGLTSCSGTIKRLQFSILMATYDKISAQ